MRIDVHTHIVPQKMPDYSKRAGGDRWPRMEAVDDCTCKIMIGGNNFRTVTDQCWSADKRLEDMDAEGVDRQVISPMPKLFSYWFEPQDTLDFSRFINGWIMELVSARPDRFYGLGQVPLQAPDLAAREIAEMKKMGLHGLEIGTNVNGKSLGDPMFLPFFQEAEAQGMPIFVHAADPGGTDRFAGPKFLENLIGFPQENSLSASTLITGGVAEKCPNLKFLFSHGGGGFAIVLPRLDQGWHTMGEFLPRPPSAYIGNFYFDSLLFDPLAIRFLIEKFGTRRVMLGTDYPFAIREAPAGKFVDELKGLPEEHLAALHSGTCLDFLGVPA